jgi:hypothetical protein
MRRRGIEMTWEAKIERARLIEEAEYWEWRVLREPRFIARVHIRALAAGLRRAAMQLEARDER